MPRPSDPIGRAAGTAIAGAYLALIAAVVAALLAFAEPNRLIATLHRPEIWAAARLSLATSTVSAALALAVAVPLGYALSRGRIRGQIVVEWLIDVPLALPPLALGVGLLIVCQSPPGRWFQDHVVRVSLAVPGIILAQTAVAAALATRLARVAFDAVDASFEESAWTYGADARAAFWRVTLPLARPGLVTAGRVAWARSLGEFGPVLVLAGTTRGQTEVLPTTIYIELQAGEVEAAAAVSVLLIALAGAVLFAARFAASDRRGAG